jgi:hypothetical protein
MEKWVPAFTTADNAKKWRTLAMKKATRALVVATVALAAASYAQPPYSMTQLWKIDAGGSAAWFANDNNTRGIGYNPSEGTLLAVSRTGGAAVYRLDPATGNAKSPDKLDLTGVSGGTLPVNLIAATSDGKLILTNLAASANPFKIYTYANESATPTNSYNEPSVTVRYGDSLSVQGSGSNIRAIVTGQGLTPAPASAAIFTSTDGGQTFTKLDLTFSPAGVPGVFFVDWDPSATDAFFFRKCASTGTETPALRRYTLSGSTATQDATFGDKLATLAGVGAFDVKQTANGNLLVANTYGALSAGATNMPGTIYHIPSETLLAQTATGLEKAGGANLNGNGSGTADMDLVGKRAFFLYTNNSISAWQIPTEVTSGVADWNLY